MHLCLSLNSTLFYSYSAKSVSIDWHSSAETCLKIVNHCSADIIVVDKPHQLDKILKVFVNVFKIIAPSLLLGDFSNDLCKGIDLLQWSH